MESKGKCSAEEISGTHIQKLLANFMVKPWFFLKKGCGSVGRVCCGLQHINFLFYLHSLGQCYSHLTLFAARMDHDRSRASSRARTRASIGCVCRCPSPRPRRSSAPTMIHPGGKHPRRGPAPATTEFCIYGHSRAR